MEIDPQTKLYVREEADRERNISDGKYAPIILWTGFLGLMVLFAGLLAPRIVQLLGL